MIPLWFMTG